MQTNVGWITHSGSLLVNFVTLLRRSHYIHWSIILANENTETAVYGVIYCLVVCMYVCVCVKTLTMSILYVEETCSA